MPARGASVLLLAVAFACGCAAGSTSGTPTLRAPAATPPPEEASMTDPLLPRLRGLIAASGIESVAVAYHDLACDEQLLLDADEIFHAASMMKVPVMMAIVLSAEEGEISLTQPVTVRNAFTSIYDGSPFSVESERDSDPKLHQILGQELPLEELVHRMVVRSSNLATNLVIEQVGAPRVEALMRSVGAGTLRVLRGVEDMRAFDAGLNNTATAHDLMQALLWIARREREGSAPARRMAEILRQQEHLDGIPAGLPEGVAVGNKTGFITSIQHDAGIVYPPGESPYVLVVLTRGFEDRAAARHLIAAISRAVWEARNPSPSI